MSHSTVEAWQSGKVYNHGTVVTHKGAVYQKLDDGDNTEPDLIGGGWVIVEHTNLAEYNALAVSLNGYEERVRQHKAGILAKLQAAGLNPDDVKAVLDAG